MKRPVGADDTETLLETTLEGKLHTRHAQTRDLLETRDVDNDADEHRLYECQQHDC